MYIYYQLGFQCRDLSQVIKFIYILGLKSELQFYADSCHDSYASDMKE